VGDVEFQKKCLGRMDNVAKEGRTVLFVSHNMPAVRRLCEVCVLLERGRLTAIGETSEVVGRYLASGTDEFPAGSWIDVSTASRSGSGIARFVGLRYSSLNEAVGLRPYPCGPLEFELTIDSQVSRSSATIALSVRDQHGTKLINADSGTIAAPVVLRPGVSTWRLVIEQLYLKPGSYVVGLWLADRVGELIDRVGSVCRIEVVDSDSRAVGTRVDPRYDGVVACRFSLNEIT
jgi:lipopolysaccharide transport system ATP-binding protein